MLMNSRYAAAWAKSYYLMLFEPSYQYYTRNSWSWFSVPGAIYLCTGSIPTDAEVAAMVDTSSSRITSNTAVTYGSSDLTLADISAIPPVFNLTLPASPSSATRTGTITWDAIFGGDTQIDGFPSVPLFLAVADVSVTGGGGAVQVDTLTIPSVGTKVTLTSFSVKPWRQ